MSILRNKKILFFAPKFFGYENEITNKLIELGAEVFLYDERPSNNFLTKLLIRINPKLLKRFIKNHYSEIIERHKDIDFEYILFLQGETVSKDLLINLKSKFPNSKKIIYLTDSLANYPHLKESLSSFDKALSFDLEDTKNIENLEFRPLFFIDDYRKLGSLDHSSIKYDILFIGTVHSDRWPFLSKIKTKAEKEELSVYYYLYFQSPIIFLIRKLANKFFWSIPFKYAQFKSLPKSRVISLIEKSRVIVDIQHPKQSGLTMRTIEILGANRKLITTNRNITKYDFFNPSNILVVDRVEPIIDFKFIKSNFVLPDGLIYEKYSIDNWLIDVFS